MTMWQAGMKMTAARLGQHYSGTVSVPVAAAASKTQTVVFPVAFGTTPRVFLNMDDAPSGSANWSCRAINRTATQFQIYMSGPSATFSTNVSWVATTV